LTAASTAKFIGFELVALVTFRANDPAFAQVAFGPDDLQVKVLVWTELIAQP